MIFLKQTAVSRLKYTIRRSGIISIIYLLSVSYLRAEDNNEAQKQNRNDKDPFSISVSVMGDFASNLQGGVRKAGTYMGMVQLMTSFDFEKAGLWKGGQLFLRGLNTHGGLATENLIGDVQVCSNIEAGDYTGLFEYYFRQRLGAFTFLIGQHDLNSEFVMVENGSGFINSSFGVPASISLNFPTPIFPMASLGVVASYSPNPHLKIIAGLYDGDPGDFETNRYGIHSNVCEEEGYLSIGELQYHFLNEDQEPTGSYKIGGYYHSANYLCRVDAEEVHNGQSGFYFVMDQNLFVKDHNKVDGLRMFGQIGWNPSPSSFVDFYCGGGVTYTSLFAKDGRDQMGIGIAHTSINNKILPEFDQFGIGAESAIEFTYNYRVTDYLEIQPDLQYIVKTKKEENDRNAMVGIIRIKFEY